MCIRDRADGTSLYVNAGTKVVYPSVFEGKSREIYVDGEIFIDVKKDTDCLLYTSRCV